MFFKKATKFDEIFTIDVTVTTYCQIDGEDFVNFSGLLRKRVLTKGDHHLHNLEYQKVSQSMLFKRS